MPHYEPGSWTNLRSVEVSVLHGGLEEQSQVVDGQSEIIDVYLRFIRY